jgi:hypothetical protein
MTGYFIFMGGILAFVWIIALLDWLGRRKQRRSHPPFIG